MDSALETILREPPAVWPSAVVRLPGALQRRKYADRHTQVSTE